MKLDSKQVVSYRNTLYSAQNDVGIHALQALLEHHIEKAKNVLLTCTPDEVPKQQGLAAGYNEVLKWVRTALTTPIDNP